MAINLGGGVDQVARDRQQAMVNNAAYWQQRGPQQSAANRDLEQRRGQLDQSYANLRQIIQPMAAGQNGPFSRQVVQGLNAGASDNAAGQMRAARAVIDRSFGRQGLAGSGGAMRAKLDAQRQIGKGLMAQRTQIGTQAELENRAAQERGLRDLMGLLDMETAHNSRFSVTGDSPFDGILGTQGGDGGGAPLFAGLLSGGGRQRSSSGDAAIDAILGFSGAPTTGGSFSTWNQAPARTGFAPGQSLEDWLGISDFGTGNYQASGPMGGMSMTGVPGAATISNYRRTDYDPTVDMTLRKYAGFPAAIVNGRPNPAYPSNVIGRDVVPMPWDYWTSDGPAVNPNDDGGFVEKWLGMNSRLQQPAPAPDDFAGRWWDLYNRYGEPRAR